MEAGPRRSWVEQVMGLPVSVLARGPGATSPEADAAVRDVYDELREIDRDLSPYRTDSLVSRIAAGELDPADAGPLVREVTARCEHARELTGGLFDASRPDGRWDPSGLVKGWAAERAAARLFAVAGPDWCLNAGGDVVVRCPSGVPFTVGIQDPRDPARVAAAVPCAAGAVATSGTAARGAHLYDPRTGLAPGRGRGWLSVTVTGPSLEVADVLATAAYVAADGWPEVLGRVPGYAGLGIDAAGRPRPGAGWPAGGTLGS